MSPSAVDGGVEVLLLGKIDHAQKEWEALSDVAALRVTRAESFKKLQCLGTDIATSGANSRVARRIYQRLPGWRIRPRGGRI